MNNKICSENPKLGKTLAFLFFQPVFEKHENGPLDTIDILVFKHTDHCVGVHALTGKELKILEFPHHFLHDLVDIGLEFIDFALAVFLLQIFQDFLHVGLEVISEALLIAESGFDKSVVEHNSQSLTSGVHAMSTTRKALKG